MNKISYTFITTFSIISLVSCSNSSDEGTHQQITVKDEKSANDIITFNNNLLEKTKNQTRHIEGISRYIETAQHHIQPKPGAIITPSLIAPININISTPRNAIKDIPDGLGNKKNTVKEQYDMLTISYDSIGTAFDSYKKYIEAQDFKDDKGAKAKDLEAIIARNIITYASSKAEVFDEIQEATDAAEAVILKDHPLKDYILSAKKVVLASDNLYNAFVNQYNNETLSTDILQQQYDILEKDLATAKELKYNVSDKSYAAKESSFNGFNDQAETFLGTSRKAIRDIKENASSLENSIRQVESSYESVISRYNTFVR